MYTRISKKVVAGITYEYLQLIEGYRVGTKVRKKVIQCFGRLDVKNSSAAFVQQLLADKGKLNLTNRSAKLYGLPTAIYTIFNKTLEIPVILQEVFSSSGIQINVSLLTALMVIHRIMDPDSKLALSRWYKNILLPVPLPVDLDVHSLYKTLDYLTNKKEAIELALFEKLKTKGLIDPIIVFYDLTSSYFEGDTCPISCLGHSRDYRPDRPQITLGLVIDKKNGLPIFHEVFEGNMSDSKTVKGILEKLKTMFNLENIIFVADKGMLSPDNLKELEEKQYQSILSESVRNALSQKQREKLFLQKDGFTKFEGLKETLWYKETKDKKSKDIIICYNQYTALKAKTTRDLKLKRIEEFIKETKEKHKDETTKKAIQKVRDTILAKLVTSHTRKYFDAKTKEKTKGKETKEKTTINDLFPLKAEVIRQEEYIDGMWAVRSNVNLTTEELIKTYKDLKTIEASFRTIKDVIELRPIYHHKTERVKGHVFICILAFLVARLLELKTKTSIKMLREKYLTAVAVIDENNQEQEKYILGGQDLLKAVQA